MKRIAIVQQYILTQVSTGKDIGKRSINEAYCCSVTKYTLDPDAKVISDGVLPVWPEWINLPEYYRRLYECNYVWFDSYFYNSLKAFLKDNLTLDRSGNLPGKPGLYKESFLCAEIDDEDLPWYTTESN